MALCLVILAVAVTATTALNSAPSAIGRGAVTITGTDAPALEMTAEGFGSDLSRLESLVYTLGDQTQQVVATPEDSVWTSAAGILQARKASAAASVYNATREGVQEAMGNGVQAEAQAPLNALIAAASSTLTSSAALAALIADRWHQTQQQVASIGSLAKIVAAHATIANASDGVQPSVMTLSSSDQMFSAAEKDANAGLIMLVTDVETVVHKSLGPLDELASRLPQWIQPWMLLVPVGIITLGIVYYIYSEMTAAPAPAGGNGSPAKPAEDDDDWDLLDEKRMQKLFGKPCMRGWCCCTFMVLVNQCPTSLYLFVFLTGGFWTLWRYHMIQPVLQQLMVYLYMALAIIFIAVLIVMNIFAGLKRAGRQATKAGEDAVNSLQEGFQAIQQGLDNVMDAINPFDDSSGEDSEDDDKKEPEVPPDDSLTLEDLTCGLWPDAPSGQGEPVVFNKEDRVKCRDGPGRWFHGFVVGEGKSGKNVPESLPCTIGFDRLQDPSAFARLYVHCDTQTNARKGWVEIKHIKKGDAGYKTKAAALKKLRANQHKQKWHGGMLPAMPAAPSCTSGAAPAS